MKSLSLNVPDEQAQAFAKELATLLQKHGVEVENKEAIDSLLPITERVKTFDDAVNILGVEHPMVTMYKAITNLPDRTNDDKHIIAYAKLCIITAALNEGWEPQFTEDEYRYFPWFVFYTQSEIDEMDDEDKEGIRVLGRSGLSASAYAGVAYSLTSNASSGSYAGSGGRLCFKTRELAKYAGEQFLDIWADYVVGF
ncbi:MAG: hypothetical protein IJ064_05725 [Bacteroidaceae bacterium]|nr:hypothetical protein [Bacteroidaceae bacterium]